MPYADDAAFRDAFRAQRVPRKLAVARLAEARMGNQGGSGGAVRRADQADPRVQAPIAERAARDLPIQRHPRPADAGLAPAAEDFGRKAAPGYIFAKEIIRLAHDVARLVNHDPTVRGLLQVAFLPNYNVSLAEVLIPAADLSEQISTAGMEASGTGNMKLALNGALTIGTMDGANVEIAEHVGVSNMFIFGMTAEQVAQRRAYGLDATDAVAACPALGAVLDALRSGVLSPEQPDRYRAMADRLERADPFFVPGGFRCVRQGAGGGGYAVRDKAAWWRAAVLNTAGMGWFSADGRSGSMRRGLGACRPWRFHRAGGHRPVPCARDIGRGDPGAAFCVGLARRGRAGTQTRDPWPGKRTALRKRPFALIHLRFS